MVYLYLLDDCTIRTRTGRLTPRAKKLFAIAAYLILERGSFIPRRRLLSLFWPAIPARDALHPLREALRKLRRAGIPIVNDPLGHHVTIAKHHAVIDVDLIPHADLSELLTHDFTVLPTYAPALSAAHDDWIDDTRTQLRATLTRHIRDAIERARALNDWPVAHALTQRLHATEPIGLIAPSTSAMPQRTSFTTPAPRSPLTPTTNPSSLLAHTTTPQPQPLTTHLAVHHREQTPRIYETPWHASTHKTPLLPTPIVGRSHDLTTLTHALTRAARGKGTAIALTGPAGIGKSRILREVARLARYENARVTRATALPHRLPPLAHSLIPWTDLLSALLQFPGAGGCDPATLHTVNQFISATPAPATIPRDASELPSALAAALTDLVDAVTYEQPVVLILDDAHHAAPASQALLQHVAATSTHHALLCLTAIDTSPILPPTTDPSSPPRPPIPGFDAYAIPPLPPAAISRIIDVHKGGAARRAPDTWRQWCVTRANGNPLLAEELTNEWLASPIDSVPPDGVPTLDTLIDRRLATLDPLAQHFLQATAILGDYATISCIARTIGSSDWRVATLANTLRTHGFINSERPSSHTDEGKEPGHTATRQRLMCSHDTIARRALALLSEQEHQTLAATASNVVLRFDPRHDASPEASNGHKKTPADHIHQGDTRINESQHTR